MSSVDIARTDQLEEAGCLGLTLDFDPLLDLLEFVGNKGTVGVSVTMREDQDLLTFVPSILCSKPTWSLRKEHHSAEEDDSWDHLKCPRNAECGRTIDEGTTVGDV
jgi:hypothetical protein